MPKYRINFQVSFTEENFNKFNTLSIQIKISLIKFL